MANSSGSNSRIIISSQGVNKSTGKHSVIKIKETQINPKNTLSQLKEIPVDDPCTTGSCGPDGVPVVDPCAHGHCGPELTIIPAQIKESKFSLKNTSSQQNKKTCK